MGIRTGKPRGRPKGSKSKRTKEVAKAMERAATQIADALPEAFDGDAHALLMAVYKDETRPIEVRLEAAKAAIRYEKPALAAIDVTSTNEHTIYELSSEPISLDEWEAKHCKTEH